MIHRYVCLVALSLVTLMQAQTSLDLGYRRGMAAYDREQWTLVIQEFEIIIRAGYESPLLFYNLGNAYYRTNDVPGAVWAYEKALILNPNDDDARYNLSLANLRVIDRIEPPEIPFIIRTYRGFRDGFTPTEWVQGISWLLLFTGLAFALGRIAWSGFTWLVGPLVIAIILVAPLTLDSILTSTETSEGVVYGKQVTVLSAPTDRSTALFELHEGIKVSIVAIAEDWYQIELIDGNSGWLPREQIRPI